MADFPDSIKTWSDKTDLVDFFTAANLNDDIMDEIIALQTAAIGHTRGGPLDLYMTSDPGFDQSVGNGATDLVYSATNDRYECVCDDDDQINGVYRVLPTPLQITPGPSAIAELVVEFEVGSLGTGSVGVRFHVGFRDFTETDENLAYLGMSILTNAGGVVHRMRADACGTVDNGAYATVTSPTVGTRYQMRIGWQTHGPSWLVAAIWNAETGALVGTEVVTPVLDATSKDVALPHFGIWCYGASGADPMTVYVYDIFARVLRG
jgi:hypothetical protein